MLTHTTPIHNANTTFPQIVHSENLPMSGCPYKESYTGRSSHLPNYIYRYLFGVRGIFLFCFITVEHWQIDDEMEGHSELLKEIQDSPTDINAIVARRRKDFTGEFFRYLTLLSETYDSLEDHDGNFLYFDEFIEMNGQLTRLYIE
jgi:hypothetical protein